MTDEWRFQAVVFDMDNTLLSSRIDFPAMKLAVYRYLMERGLLPDLPDWKRRTTSELIELARTFGRMTPPWFEEVWELVARFETEGMRGAGLEPDVAEMLEQLDRQVLLAVLTNNAYEAAETALRETGIYDRFRYVMGREQAGELKPSPSGLLQLRRLEPGIASPAWLYVGDSWIDGQCALAASMSFASYQADEGELESRGIVPIARLHRMADLLPVVKG